MTDRPDPHAPTVLMAPRRRRWWPWLLLAPLVLATAAVLAAPWATCRMIASRTPFPSGDLIVRGARLGGEAPTAMVVAVCDPATFRAICEGASGRWLPPILLADGQHAWGMFREAPEITWRLDLDRTARIPRITARIPTRLAETLLRTQLAADRSPVSDARIGEFHLVGEPGAGDEMHWDLRLACTATVAWGTQTLPVAIDRLHARGASRIDGGTRRMSGELSIVELRGTVPLLGPLEPLTRTLEKQANQRLGQELPKTLVPDWWPSTTHWDLEAVPGAMAEF